MNGTGRRGARPIGRRPRTYVQARPGFLLPGRAVFSAQAWGLPSALESVTTYFGKGDTARSNPRTWARKNP
jgi:hypothetical protein